MTQDPGLPPQQPAPQPGPARGAAPSGQLASEGQRILAALLDGIIMAPIALIPILGWIVIVAYGLLKDALPFLNGQSIGKKIMKIRVVSSETGQPITGDYGPAAIRQVVFYIPFFVIVELIVMCTRPEKNRLGDDWGKTRVIVDNG